MAGHVDDFLATQVERVWPNVTTSAGSMRPHVLIAEDPPSDGVYFRANVDPSDRYVQSLPGSGAHRLRVDQSGVTNLVLAGDWTNCGLNAGCVEAAVMSGIEAANVIRGRPLTDGLAGHWYGLDDSPGRMSGGSDGQAGGRAWREATV